MSLIHPANRFSDSLILHLFFLRALPFHADGIRSVAHTGTHGRRASVCARINVEGAALQIFALATAEHVKKKKKRYTDSLAQSARRWLLAANTYIDGPPILRKFLQERLM